MLECVSVLISFCCSFQSPLCCGGFIVCCSVSGRDIDICGGGLAESVDDLWAKTVSQLSQRALICISTDPILTPNQLTNKPTNQLTNETKPNPKPKPHQTH